jgi:hypothetical protein
MAGPHVSITYWQEVVNRYSKYTIEKNTNEKVFSALLTNQNQPILNMLMENGDYEDAKLVWLTRYRLAKRPEGINTSYPLTKEIIVDIEKKMENLSTNDELYMIVHVISKEKLSQGLTIQAACSYLAIKDYFNTFKTLIRSDELEIAYLLMKIINYNLYEVDIMIGLATKALKMGRTETFFTIFNMVEDIETKAILMNLFKTFKNGSEDLSHNILSNLKPIESELLNLITSGNIHQASTLFKEHFDEFAESIAKGKLNLDNYKKILKTISHMRVINFNTIDK